jgi:hypothetical protein
MFCRSHAIIFFTYLHRWQLYFKKLCHLKNKFNSLLYGRSERDNDISWTNKRWKGINYETKKKIILYWIWSSVSASGAVITPVRFSFIWIKLHSVGYTYVYVFKFTMRCQYPYSIASKDWTIEKSDFEKLWGSNLNILPKFVCRDWGNKVKFSQDSRCPGRDSNWAFPKCMSRSVPFHQPIRSVKRVKGMVTCLTCNVPKIKKGNAIPVTSRGGP